MTKTQKKKNGNFNRNDRRSGKCGKRKRFLFCAACTLLFFAVFFCFPVFAMSFHAPRISIGSTIVICISILLLFRMLLTDFFGKLRKSSGFRRAEACISVCLAIGFLYAFFVSSLMLRASFNTFSAETEADSMCLVVLGCQVRGTVPSLSLDRRIQAAQDFMEAHPASVAVVSGGQGAGEHLSEAAAMKKQLVENGIGEERIHIEDRSTDTSENIAYSAEIIEREGLSKNVIIVTDSYHQYRAHVYAEKNGLTPSPLSSRTPWYLIGGYWAREILGNGYYLLFGFE